MTIRELRKRMPRVGDVRMETMTMDDRVYAVRPEKCVVVEVNEERLWYRVRFERTGTCECYKLPMKSRSEGYDAAP